MIDDTIMVPMTTVYSDPETDVCPAADRRQSSGLSYSVEGFPDVCQHLLYSFIRRTPRRRILSDLTDPFSKIGQFHHDRAFDSASQSTPVRVELVQDPLCSMCQAVGKIRPPQPIFGHHLWDVVGTIFEAELASVPDGLRR